MREAAQEKNSLYRETIIFISGWHSRNYMCAVRPMN